MSARPKKARCRTCGRDVLVPRLDQLCSRCAEGGPYRPEFVELSPEEFDQAKSLGEKIVEAMEAVAEGALKKRKPDIFYFGDQPFLRRVCRELRSRGAFSEISGHDGNLELTITVTCEDCQARHAIKWEHREIVAADRPIALVVNRLLDARREHQERACTHPDAASSVAAREFERSG